VLLVNDVFPANKHVVAHEYAHGLWHRVMSDNRRADWIELYTSHVELDATKANVVKNVIADCKELSGKGALKNLVTVGKKVSAMSSLRDLSCSPCGWIFLMS